MKTIFGCSLIIALSLVFVPAYAGDLQEGVEAYKDEDFETVLTKWQPLAERGDPKAQFNLGMMYYDGYGDANNYFAAAKWFWRASKQGHAKAQLKLGTMYYQGIGVDENKSKAAKLYRMSAKGGNGKAQTLAGLVYGEGLGVDQDFKEAAKWYELAANKGFATAQYNLGVMYRDGNGVDMDMVKAYTWFLIASENDNDDADNGKDEIVENMAQEQISEGKKMAAIWIKKHPKKE
ncbi:MAG: tetratricopeptide repeat protein [Nitrospinales bacterium]